MPEIDLFAVQARVSGETYRSEASFRAAAFHLGRACGARRRSENTPAVAVFPENFATFLVLAPLGRAGQRLNSTELATVLAIALRPRRFSRALRATGKPKIAALLALAPEVRAIWERTFSDLARETGMSIVAGSALLPDGDERRVFNLSLTFDPEGRVAGTTRKVNLVPGLEDTLGLTPGSPEALVPVDLPVGPVGTLICYDGFAVPHTVNEPGFVCAGRGLAERGARIVANPAANPWPWEGPWVHARAGSLVLRREQWRAEGIEAQLRDMEGVRWAVTAHLVGRVLDQRFDGRSAIYERDQDGRVKVRAEAASASSEEIVHARVLS